MKIIEKLKQIIAYKRIESGRLTWETFTSVLPEAVGSLEEDAPRMAEFQNLVSCLNEKKKRDLRCYLQAQLAFYENEPELITASSERFFQKWRQIYREHLKYVN